MRYYLKLNILYLLFFSVLHLFPVLTELCLRNIQTILSYNIQKYILKNVCLIEFCFDYLEIHLNLGKAILENDEI